MFVAKFIVILCLSYLAGSVNFSIILFRLLGKDDPRTSHSGNAGVTNVYRQAGMFWAGLVLALDIGRAVGIAALSVYYLPVSAVPWAGLALVSGNRFTLFHGFRGGKGVANYLGFTAYLSPATAMVSCAAWVVVYGIARIPFIASFFMVAVLAGGTFVFFSQEPLAAAGSSATCVFIIASHAGNIIEFRQRNK